MASQRKSPMDHPAVVTFLILAIIGAMSLAAEVLKPLALAVLLSFALAPLAGFFERRRVPRAAAVLLTVALALGLLSGIGYVVVRQLSMLAYQLPSYQERIQKKVDFLKPSDDTAFYRAKKVASDVAKSLDTPVIPGHEAMDVRVLEEPTFRQRLQTAVGPSLEFIGVGSFVLILVLFMLMNREVLGDRIVQLFGQRQINLTTRTMGEIGQRISRYLAMITLVNSGYGLSSAWASGRSACRTRCSGVVSRRWCGTSPTSGRRWRSFCRLSSRPHTSPAGGSRWKWLHSSGRSRWR